MIIESRRAEVDTPRKDEEGEYNAGIMLMLHAPRSQKTFLLYGGNPGEADVEEEEVIRGDAAAHFCSRDAKSILDTVRGRRHSIAGGQSCLPTDISVPKTLVQ